MQQPVDTQTGAPERLTISEEDVLAYAQGGLHPSRRAQIEGFLACNPDLAADVMRALHVQNRASAAAAASPPRARRSTRRSRLVAACVACGIAGWAVAQGFDEDGPFPGLLVPPEYVEDALMSRRVTLVRIAMDSQIQTPQLDVEELRRTMSIRLPTLPADWRLLDTQVYPSEEGPSVSMLFETAPGRTLNLFAVRANTAATGAPAITRHNGQYAAYWELDGAAYVLTGDYAPREILARASLLSQRTLM